MPQQFRPRRNGIVIAGMVFGIAAGIAVAFGIAPAVDSFGRAIRVGIGVAGTISILGLAISWLIDSHSRGLVKLGVFALPIVAVVLVPFAIWQRSDPETSINERRTERFMEAQGDPETLAWEYMTELVSTMDTWPGDYRRNDSDTDGIDSRSYVCAPADDDANRDLMTREGLFPAIDRDGGGYGAVRPGEADPVPGPDGSVRVTVVAEYQRGPVSGGFRYAVTVHPREGGEWCVGRIAYVPGG